jgi:regulatory protein
MRKSPSNTSTHSYSFIEIVTRLEAFCAYQDRSEKEVRQKLSTFELSIDDNERVIKHLFEHRFLDEERFVLSFIHGKFRIKKWGRIKLKSELRKKGIAGSLIDRYLKELEGDQYIETIHSLIEKKYSQLSAEKDAFNKKVKVIRFVASKGFELDLIQDAYIQIDLKHH